MAQLTMQRNNPISYEGRVSLSQATEAKPDSYKSQKSESSDHFQKSMSERQETQADNKKISDRSLKRRQETNDTRSAQTLNKKQKLNHQTEKQASLPSTPEKQIQEPTQLEPRLIIHADEPIDRNVGSSIEMEEIDLTFIPQEPESVTSERLAKQRLKDDLASIATLDEQGLEIETDIPQSSLTQEEPATLIQTAQDELSISHESSKDELSAESESSVPQLSNSLISAAQINDEKQTESTLTKQENPHNTQSVSRSSEALSLFTGDQMRDKADLEDISELSMTEVPTPKETTKRNKSTKTEEAKPEQLHFAFMDKNPNTEIKPLTPEKLGVAQVMAQEADQKSQAQVNAELITLQEKIDTNGDVKEINKSDFTLSVKPGSLSEQEIPQFTSESSPDAFGISVKPLDTQGTLFTSTASTTPSIMSAPNQTPPEQVAVRLITALNNGDDQIHIRLTPEDLGEITIKLNISDQRVNALIQSDNAETLKLLQKESQTLENALKESGFTLDANNMEFSFSGGQTGQDQAALQKEMTQLRSSLLNDDMLSSLAELSALDSQEHDYILTPNKVDIHI